MLTRRPISLQMIWYPLRFIKPVGTSRGTLTDKPGWFLLLSAADDPGQTGIGECSIIPGLSPDNQHKIEEQVRNFYQDGHLNDIPDYNRLSEYPALAFAMEMAWTDLMQGGKRILFPSSFTEGRDFIPINGLIWMASVEEMKAQLKEKIDHGYRCVKLKIGALHFEDELKLLRFIRNEYKSQGIEIRLDANGAFKPNEALEKLQALSAYDIHSIEQPIKAGQWQEMAHICEHSPIPIALDEELIGITQPKQRALLLASINPHFLILKPSLLGGFRSCEDWIDYANQRNIGWWVTSALESNIGLNAISQWAYTLPSSLRQGLGTGGLFTNNIPSPLYIESDTLRYEPKNIWQLASLEK